MSKFKIKEERGRLIDAEIKNQQMLQKIEKYNDKIDKIRAKIENKQKYCKELEEELSAKKDQFSKLTQKLLNLENYIAQFDKSRIKMEIELQNQK